MNRFLPLIVTAILAGAAGFGVGRLGQSPPSAPTSALDAGPASSRTDRSRDLSGASTSASPQPGQRGSEVAAAATVAEPIGFEELMQEFESLQRSGWMGLSGIRGMSRLAERIEVSDLSALSAELVSQPNAMDRMMAVYLVINAYAERDPDGAWQLVMNMPRSQMRQAAISSVASGITQRDPKRAMALADSVEDTQTQQQIRSTAVAMLATRDPQSALDLYLENPDRSSQAAQYDSAIMSIFHQWAGKDIEAAKAAARNLDGRMGEQAQSALLQGYAQNDPEGAWNYALTLPRSSEGYRDPRLQVISNWANTDPQAAMSAVSQVEDSSTRDMAMSNIISSWARNDFDAALSFALSTESSTLRSDMFRSLAGQSSGNRDKMLTAVLDYMPPGNSFQQAVGQVLSGWAQEDPAAAAEAVFRLPPGQVVANAAAQVAQQWANKGQRTEALAWARRLPEGETRLNSVQAVFRQWASDDAQSAQAALSTLHESERSRAVRAIAEGWSQRDPEAVVRWSRSLATDEERRDVLRSGISTWARSAPEAAARAVSQVPESERGPAMEAVVREWSSKDATAAGDWLKSQPAGAQKDGAISALARSLVGEDPESALTWASQISDAQNRDRQIERHARTWLNNEPQTARAWIASSSLVSQETRTKLLK